MAPADATDTDDMLEKMANKSVGEGDGVNN